MSTRLERLVPTLSAKERAIMLIRAANAGVQADPAVRRTMPPEQRLELNRILNVAIAANGSLATLCLFMSRDLQALRVQLKRIELVEQAAMKLRGNSGAEAARHRRRAASASGVLQKLVADLRAETWGELKVNWQELLAVEAVWAEINLSLDGEGAASPESRELAESGRQELLSLVRALGRTGQRAILQGPTEELISQLRQIFQTELESLNQTEY